MNITLEISPQEAEECNISASSITLEQLRRKIALTELRESLKESHKAAKLYGIDKWTMDDINNMIKEAREYYNDKSSD